MCRLLVLGEMDRNGYYVSLYRDIEARWVKEILYDKYLLLLMGMDRYCFLKCRECRFVFIKHLDVCV